MISFYLQNNACNNKKKTCFCQKKGKWMNKERDLIKEMHFFLISNQEILFVIQ
jgi:hypothetical protein